MPNIISNLESAQATWLNVFVALFRWIAPILIIILLFRCIKPLLSFRREPEIWAWLCLDDGTKLPITHWESVIGSNKNCDVVINAPSVAKVHAVLTRYDDGSWTISSTDTHEGVCVNKCMVQIWALTPDDVIDIGNVKMKLQPISPEQEAKLAEHRTKASGFAAGVSNLLLLSVLQMLCILGFLLSGDVANARDLLIGFGGIMILEWLLLLFYVCIRRTAFEVETIAFFLCTMGMAAIATVCPEDAVKQLIALALGVVVFLLVGWSLRDMERAKTLRYVACVAGICFLLVTLLFGKEYYGAKNWLEIGPFSLQPSELTKVCFVFVGAATMDSLMKRKNLILFIAYSVAICGCLALMNDFGTALIFFVAFLVIAFMRSGSFGTLALALTALGFAGVVAMRIAPHMLQRFATWGHIWEDPLGAGYQQTRALMCMSSGGLAGVGIGQGWMRNVFAADSDMVIATLGEEWGLYLVIVAVLCIVALALFALRSAAVGRSSLYTIGACTAGAIMVTQVILNVLGTVDILPLTGVTFPFLSNGGSSMICAWGLLAFIKAADTRQNASFAVRLAKNGGMTDA